MEEKYLLLERSLKEYRRELRVSQLMSDGFAAHTQATSNQHYLDYLRAVVHELTRPKAADFDDFWCPRCREQRFFTHHENRRCLTCSTQCVPYTHQDVRQFQPQKCADDVEEQGEYRECPVCKVPQWFVCVDGEWSCSICLRSKEDEEESREEGEQGEYRECPVCKGTRWFVCLDDEWSCSICLWSKESAEAEESLDRLLAGDVDPEETIRGIPVAEYNDAVEEYMAAMDTYLDKQFPESGKVDEGDEENDLVWMWCPDCCIRLYRSIAKMDKPCGVCNSQLSTAIPLDWEDRQLQRFRGPQPPKEAPADDLESDGEETEGRPALKYPRLRWCPTCQDSRYRSANGESYCLICRTELTDEFPPSFAQGYATPDLAGVN